MRLSLSLSDLQWKSKPADKSPQQPFRLNSIEHNMRKAWLENPHELADLIERGQTFMAATFSTYPAKAVYWESQQLFVVDMDCEPEHVVQYADALKYTAQLGIPPALAYHTFSNTLDVPRYRFIWWLSEPVKSKRIQRIIADCLLGIFRDHPIDKVVTKTLRTFVFGSKQGSVSKLHMQPTNPDAFVTAYSLTLANPNDSQNRRTMETAARALGLRTTGTSALAVFNIPRGADADPDYITNAQRCRMASPDENTEQASLFMKNVDGSLSVFELASTEESEVDDDTGMRVKPVKTERSEKTSSPVDMLNNIDWAAVNKADALYRDHMAGKYIPHNLRFLLAINMAHLKGGEKRFRDGMARRWEIEKHTDSSWLDRWTRVAHAVFTRKQYAFGHYTHPNVRDLIDEYYPTITSDLNASCLYVFCLKDRRNRVVTLKTPTLATASEVHTMVKDHTDRIVSSGQQGVYVIRADTGTGKSTIIRNIQRRALVAIPRHDLIDEYVEKYAHQGRYDVKSTPPHPDLEEMTAVIHSYYHVGAGKAARQVLYNLQNLPEVWKFFDLESRALAHTGTLLTTHTRLPHISTDHDLILIDEDPLGVLTPAGNVELSALQTLLGLLRNAEAKVKKEAPRAKRQNKKARSLSNPTGVEEEELPTLTELKRDIDLVQGLITLVEESTPSLPVLLPPLAFANAAYIQKLVIENRGAIRGNLLHLFDALGFVKSSNKNGDIVINYVVRKELPRDKTIIIYSATLDQVTARSFFGSQLIEYIDTPPVELRGEIIQHVLNTSRASLLKNIDIVDASRFIADGLCTFTFKDTQRLFDNVAGYYGAVAGLNKWEGQDICLIGTPHMHPDYYVLRALALGYKLRSTDLAFGEQEIEIDGMTTRFPTYAHPILQHIQLNLIRTEMLQTIGRARAVWNDVRIVIVSNLPMMHAIFKHYTGAEVKEMAEHQRRIDAAAAGKSSSVLEVNATDFEEDFLV